MKRIALLATMIMMGSLVATAPLAAAPLAAAPSATTALVRTGEVVRIAGPDRFATAAAAARAGWPDGAEIVVLATGFDYPDALAGGALAAAHDAPLLLATTHALPAPVRDALVALDPDRVFVLGGRGALSDDLVRAVRDLPGGPDVTRVAGANRFETAAAVAAAAGRTSGGPVIVATGMDYPDAVAAGALAAGDTATPVVLATRERLITPLSPGERPVLVGGHAALGPAVEQQARDQAGSVARLAGPNRFATSQAAADHALRHRLTGRVPLIVATGQQYADALAAGAVTARSGGTLLLTPASGPTPDQATWIRSNRDRLTGIVVIGGASAISDAGARQLRDVLRAVDPAPAPQPQPQPSSCVDINRQNNLEELERIIHIGPVRAPLVIQHRPYNTLDDLQKIPGIGPARVRDIKAQGLAAVAC